MDIAGDALYYLAVTYNDMGADDWAREKLIALAERFPNSLHAASGRKLFASLNAKQETETVALSTDRSTDSAEFSVSVSPNGVHPQAVTPTALTPVTSLRPAPNGSSPAETTLCRLGVWC
jgi:outer membrane protein assembly factor BamD